MNNINLKYITLKYVPGFFKDERIKKILEVYNIVTLDDFFKAFENPEFIKFLESPYFIGNFQLKLQILKEISATVKLLRCKYLGENPNIDINDDITIDEIVDRLGLSIEIGEELTRIKKDNDFFYKLSQKTLQQKQAFLRRITNLSEQSIEELSYRLQIINDYEEQKEVDKFKKESPKKTQMKEDVSSKKPKEKRTKKGKGKKKETEEERDARLKEVMKLHPRANIITTETEEERLQRLGALVSSLPAFKRK